MGGLNGNMQAQPRVFAHDAQVVYTDKRLIWLDIQSLNVGSGYTAGAKTVTGADSGANNATVTITVDAAGAITTAVITAVGSGYTDGEILTIAGGTGGTVVGHTSFIGSEERGACIYVGNSGDVEVVMESGNTVVFANAATGSFLPILVKQVISTNTTATSLLALFLHMWLGIGYTIPQWGDRNGGGGVGPINYYIVKETDPSVDMETESGGLLMVQEIAP